MHKVKPHHIALVLVLIILVAALSAGSKRKPYSWEEFGVSPLIKNDCREASDNSPVAVSFEAPNVPAIHAQIKELVAKHNGHITSDALSSYAGEDPSMPSDDNVNMTITFANSTDEFLTELGTVVKSAGGVNTGYNYTDNTAYNPVYSPLASCTSMMQTARADALILQILADNLKREGKTANITLLSQAMTDAKNKLQGDVDSLNSLFASSDKPSVTISIYTLRKGGDIFLKPSPVY
jgi:hypothetical protein